MLSLNFKGKLIFLKKPLIMGILNCTGDSFYAGSRMDDLEKAKRKADQLIAEGADIIDIGAQSTRPGSKAISAQQELDKLMPILEYLKEKHPDVIVSVDTYYSEVARECVNFHASLVNDISGGEMDQEMIGTVGKLGVPYVCMHIKGTPETMQQHTSYGNILTEIMDYFIKKIEQCRSAGIKDVIIDPGFGFAKNAQQNFQLLKNLSLFQHLNVPVLAGLSRKSTIYKTLGITAEEALNGTTVLNTIALLNGAQILRVHDVKEAKEAVELFTSYSNA